MRANPVHLVEEPFALAVQLALDTKRRELVRDHSDVPTRRIGPAAISSVHQNLRRRLRFISNAEWTILRIRGNHAFAKEFVGPFSPFRRNDHPSARDGVLPQLRQKCPPRCSSSLSPVPLTK